MQLIENLNWRYSVKKYQKTKVSEENIDKIVEAIRLSASSAGLQPYRVIVVEDEKIRAQLQENSFNPQVTEASHLIVFAAMSSINGNHIDEYMNLVATTRNIPLESLSDFKNSLSGYLLAQNDKDNLDWATRQAYIGLGTGLAAAAELQIDTTPMEGFDRSVFDTVLGLKDQNLTSVVVLALGYRDEENDFLAKAPKVRLPKEQFVMEIA